MTRWGKPIKNNMKRRDPRYFLNESMSSENMEDNLVTDSPIAEMQLLMRLVRGAMSEEDINAFVSGLPEEAMQEMGDENWIWTMIPEMTDAGLVRWEGDNLVLNSM